MKPVSIDNPVGLDRLATWNEVCCAMDVALSGRGSDVPEDVMRLAVVSAMSNARSTWWMHIE